MLDFSINTVTLLYLVASVCFIQALKGLSHPTTSIRGNVSDGWNANSNH